MGEGVGNISDILNHQLGKIQETKENKKIFEPLSPADFFLSEYHCGMPREMIPRYWLDEACDFIEGKYNELIITGSIGSFKSTWANLITMYKIYELFSNENMHGYLSIPEIQDIYNIYFSVNMTQARLTGFRQLKSMVDNSRWFREMFPRNDKLNSMIEFPKKPRFSIFSGSGHQHAIGMTVWSFILDEGDFFKKAGSGFDDNFDHVTNMYQELVDRRVSRFQKGEEDASFSILISSATFQSSFVSKRITQAKDDPKTKIVKAVKYLILPGNFAKEKILVFSGSTRVEPELVDSNKTLNTILIKLNSKHRVNHQHTVMENYENLPPELRTSFETPPIDLKKRFEDNISKALQNFCGVHVAAEGKLFQSRKLLLDNYTEDLVHPFTKYKVELSTGDDIQLTDYFLPRYLTDVLKPHAMHVDLGLTADSAGISLVRFDREEVIGNIVKRHYSQVFSLEIIPPPAPYQIKISKIRDFIIYLSKTCRVNIVKVTYDQFNSADSIQILNDNGIETGRQSVDKSDEPYLIWMGLLQDKTMKHYSHPVVEEEAFAAVHNRAKRKVDHPKKGTININTLQSLVGALRNLTEINATEKQGVDDVPLPQQGEKRITKKQLTQQFSEGAQLVSDPFSAVAKYKYRSVVKDIFNQ